MIETRNAKITGTTLGYEDHGILTVFLQLDYGGVSQAFGGYALDEHSGGRKSRAPTAVCGAWIANILTVVGVDSWEKLKGQIIRVKSDNGKVYEIGNVLKDIWFDPVSLTKG